MKHVPPEQDYKERCYLSQPFILIHSTNPTRFRLFYDLIVRFYGSYLKKYNHFMNFTNTHREHQTGTCGL